MFRTACCCSIFCLAIAADTAAKGVAAPTEDKAIAIRGHLEPGAALYRSQLLGEIDRPVGEAIVLGDRRIPARTTDKGGLEVDPLGDGKFRSVARNGTLQVTLEKPGAKPEEKRKQAITLFFTQDEQQAWRYRNATQLTLQIGPDAVAVVDANGNGAWNEPGIDGMAWAGSTWLFPLPAGDERWCTANADLTALAFGTWGEEPKAMGRALATTLPECLGVLKGVNEERVKLGLTPRPEDAKLSADLQKHCHFMAMKKSLQHPEDKGDPNYTPEGNAAGMNSILSMGTPPERIAAMMVGTYFHRQDVIRPGTRAFGVGYEARYGGIDGRRNLGKLPGPWTVLCPVPEQEDIPVQYGHESPDAAPGSQAGYPITAYFSTGRLKLTGHRLAPVGADGKAGASVDCHLFDPKTGIESSFTSYQQCVCIMAKAPLNPATVYEVQLDVEVSGSPWTRTWRFATTGAKVKRGR